MEKRIKLILIIFLLSLAFSGCQMLPVFRMTPMPLETETPQLSLNQVTDIPTLPPVTPTPTPSIGSFVNYSDPGDIFLQVREEKLPEKPFQEVIAFGTVGEFIMTTDAWGYVTSTGSFKLEHHSGTEFSVNCDDFSFYVDAHKNLVSSEKMVEGSEVIVFGTSGEDVTEINADLIAIHVIREDIEPKQVDVSIFPSNLTYTEYELESFPSLNPVSIKAAAATSTPLPTATSEATEDPYGYTYDPYSYGYGYGYDYYGYGRPTSTPNRPQRTPTPDETGTPVPTPTLSLNEHLENRYQHSLDARTEFNKGWYGEAYSSYLEYNQEMNRDPSHPTRANLIVASNGYDFTDYWIPYVESPMVTNWGIICYGGDWYLPVRLTVDIDPNPGLTSLVYTDRVIRSQQNYDKSRGYIRSFGYTIISVEYYRTDASLFYFYENENGYGISINNQDYDLGFDDIPYGYVGEYTELNPFFSDDLITFFGHRGDKWYYVEIVLNEIF